MTIRVFLYLILLVDLSLHVPMESDRTNDEDEKRMNVRQDALESYEKNHHPRIHRQIFQADWEYKEVHYEISERFSPCQTGMIISAMDHIMEETCLKFQPLSNYKGIRYTSPPYIKFEIPKDPKKCDSELGLKRENTFVGQTISYSDRCFHTMAYIIHEIFHALGVDHTTARKDRDKYVKINKENIDYNVAEANFEINVNAFTPKDFPYDYYSIMHPSKVAGAKKGSRSPPVVAVKNASACLGQRRRVSNCDWALIRLIYKCPGEQTCAQPELIFSNKETLPSCSLLVINPLDF